MQRRLVIVEGIMGSGKTTTACYLAGWLNGAGQPARALTEKKFPHPIRATDELEHWFQPWLDVTAEELAQRSLARWRRFTEASIESGTVATALDGQLFHGDLTHLFLMEAAGESIRDYNRLVAEVIRPLRPLVIYLYQEDVERAIRGLCEQRGDEWLRYQTDWKLAFPYSRRRGWEGVEGLVRLYEDYRRLTDDLFAALKLDKISIETSAGDWGAYYAAIHRALGTPTPEASAWR